MRLIYLFIFLISLTLNALSLEIIINPYSDLEYDKINTYYIDQEKEETPECECRHGYSFL